MKQLIILALMLALCGCDEYNSVVEFDIHYTNGDREIFSHEYTSTGYPYPRVHDNTKYRGQMCVYLNEHTTIACDVRRYSYRVVSNKKMRYTKHLK